MGITHATAATGVDSQDGKISKDAWNEAHEPGTLAIGQIVAVFDAGAYAITGNPEVDVVIPTAGTITSWTILADVSGTAVVDIWKDIAGSFPPTNADSITNGHEPTISSSNYATDTSLGDWSSVTLAAGDIIRFHIDSNLAIKRLSITLTYVRT